MLKDEKTNKSSETKVTVNPHTDALVRLVGIMLVRRGLTHADAEYILKTLGQPAYPAWPGQETFDKEGNRIVPNK